MKRVVVVRRQIDAVIGPAVSAIGMCVFVGMVVYAQSQPIDVLFSREFKRTQTIGQLVSIALFVLGIVIATIEHRAKQRQREREASSSAVAPTVKVRCRGCAQLNDESARFCQGCGASL